MMPQRQVPSLEFGARRRGGEPAVFNAMVFNLSDDNERELYVKVMRTYQDSLIQPPDRFFNSKDSTVHVVIEWMGHETFEDEFLLDKPDAAEEKHAEDNVLDKLASKLRATP